MSEYYLITYGYNYGSWPSFYSTFIDTHPAIWLEKRLEKHSQLFIHTWEKLNIEHVQQIQTIREK